MNLTDIRNSQNETLFTENYSICHFEDNILPFMFSRSAWLPHVGAGLAYVLVIQNIIIIRIFLQRHLLSPVSILLSLLALSDTFSVFFWFVPEHIGAIFKYYNGTAFGEYSMISASFEKYPFCALAYWARNILSSGFHSTAIVITTLLGIQKTLVMLFPVFSKCNLNKRCAIIVTIIVLTFCLGLEMPYAFFFSFNPTSNGECCKVLVIDPLTVRRFFDFSHYFRSGLLFISIVIQIMTTLYITTKLTCLRKTLWTDSKMVRRRNRRSTFIIIYITVIFILSEFPSVLVSICLELRIVKHLTAYALQYLYLIVSLGCFFNFWLYLIMSQKFRRELYVGRYSRQSRRSRSSFIII